MSVQLKAIFSAAAPVCTRDELQIVFTTRRSAANQDSLINRFEVSRITVRRPIQNLVNRDTSRPTIIRCPAKNHARIDRANGLPGRHGGVGRKATARLIGKSIVNTSKLWHQLALARGTKVIQIQRVRHVLYPLFAGNLW
jgi:DNA-binding GntR family transcriptional regulator